MFEGWKDLFRPIRVEDPEFGSMRFLRQTSTWECVAPFPPLDRTIEVLIDSPQTGPTPRQRAHWRKIIEDYSGLIDEARPAVDARAIESGATDFPFELAAINFPGDAESAYDFELTFGDPSGPPQFDVRISDGRVMEVIGPV